MMLIRSDFDLGCVEFGLDLVLNLVCGWFEFWFVGLNFWFVGGWVHIGFGLVSALFCCLVG